MIKIEAPSGDSFHSFKCGEIFCISPAVYNVTCCLCAVKTHLDQFSIHFQMQHLTLSEESINLEVLESKRLANSTNADNEESLNVKEEEDPEDDPIQHDNLTEYNSKDGKSMEQLLKKSQKSNQKLENEQKIVSVVPESSVLTMGEKSKEETLVKKPKARNSKKRKNKESKNLDEDVLLEMKSNNIKDFGNHDVEMERDWLEDDEASKTDSETGNDSIKDELPYPCLSCKRSFRSKHGLQTHNQIVHNPNKKTPKKPKDPKVEHKCDLCNEVFRIARDLRGHKWKHTGIFCDICGKPFTQTGNMMRHKQRHTGIKDHKCKECGKEFFTDKELKSHIICHTKLMPVICEICGKQCRHRGVLTAHMRRHTGERPAKCDVCGKCFFSIHDLNVHAVAHTSERPFRCDICGSTFQRRKALRVHKLIHSKDRKHVCKICGKGFAQSGGLKSHMRTHDAALEKSTTEVAQQSHVPSMVASLSTQSGDNTNDLFVKQQMTLKLF